MLLNGEFAGTDGGATKEESTTQPEEQVLFPPDFPATVFPCGPLGICGDNRASAPCGLNEYTLTQKGCTTADGQPGSCCIFPEVCGTGGYCRPTAESICRNYYKSDLQQTCSSAKTEQSHCCRRVQSGQCVSVKADTLLKMTGSLLPTGLERILLTVNTVSLPPTWFLETPKVGVSPTSWQIEQITFNKQKNQEMHIQIVYNGTYPIAKDITVVLFVFLNVSKSGLPDQMQCSAYRAFQVQRQANGTIDIN
jgi:hypothetical protein